MSENGHTSSELIQLLLDKCDRLYQENRQLKSKLDPDTDIDKVKADYEKTISLQQDKIVSLESQVAYLRRHGVHPVNVLSKKTPVSVSLTLRGSIFYPRSRNWLKMPKRR